MYGTRDASKEAKALVGKPYSETPAEGHVDNIMIAAVSRLYRVVPHGSMVTMDFCSDRLNVHLDDNKVITSVHNG